MRSLSCTGDQGVLAIGVLSVALAVINLCRRDRLHDWPSTRPLGRSGSERDWLGSRSGV